jgi:hypothetical protein
MISQFFCCEKINSYNHYIFLVIRIPIYVFESFKLSADIDLYNIVEYFIIYLY